MTTVQDLDKVQNTPPRAELTLAALAVAVHRFTGREQLSIEVRSGAGAGSLTVPVDVTDDPAFTLLADRVGEALEGARSTARSGPCEEPDGDAEVLAGLAADGTLATVQVRLPDAVAQNESLVRSAVAAALSATARTPDVAVSRLDLGTEADRELLARWDGTRAPAPAATACVHELVLAQAARTPQAPALRGAERITYRELADRSGRLAAALRGRGVRAGAVVGVLMPRSAEMVVGLLAVLRAGAAYLALDPDDHSSHNARLLADAGATLVVCDASLHDRLPEEVATHDPAAVGDEAAVGPAAVTPESVAYVSYTSGSTGEPKGVAVPHRAVARLVREPDWMEIRPDDVFLQVAPVAFDASTLEIWAPLVNGAELVLFAPGTIDAGELARTLREEGVTVVWMTAGLFHLMVEAHLEAFAGLRHVVAGGDVLAPQHVHRLMTEHPHLTFTNGYGPTENTTFTSCWTSTAAPAEGVPVPIGRPVRGTSVTVLDANLRPVPVGVRGELYAMGDGLAQGYLGRPGATAERFVPCSYPGRPGRMYRTGDLARWLPSGELEFLGRSDHQVKIQGYRVEPGTVEAQLAADPRVRQAAVVAQTVEGGGKRLIAYVTPVEGPAEQPLELGVLLREALARTLPDHMVPWAVLVRPDLPLGRNGKIDRRALPTATRVPRNVWNDFVPARTALEAEIADIWGALLGIEPIGVEDDFFDLGGHSLLAVDLIDTLRSRLRVDLQARTLYLQPTVAELAENLLGLSPSLAAAEVAR
ncbi:amino acid adenylation domain-containing protein [Streptomyces sviceus]|uniref:amino acid adenylation domain-containing protein n=1 Tax=Streptomyces sviceus TaxID=285530 RepID=UPI0036ABEFD9